MKILYQRPADSWYKIILCKCETLFEINVNDIRYSKKEIFKPVTGKHEVCNVYDVSCPTCHREYTLTDLPEKIKDRAEIPF